MPYRVDLHTADDTVVSRLIDQGALDVERVGRGAAAIMPDAVSTDQVREALGTNAFTVSPATGRDAGSVWVLAPRPFQVGPIRIVPPDRPTAPDVVRLIDAPAFGTGLHPTTALCIEALGDLIGRERPDAVLDVGTGSGVLALAALRLGVPVALGIDTDDEALRAASENARLNGLADRLRLVRGGPEAVDGAWPLVLANVLAAPLIEMAPHLARRLGHRGHLVLSGIPVAMESEVARAYTRTGMRRLQTQVRGGWAAVVMQASW